MRACRQCGDIFSPRSSRERPAGWYCSNCQAWINLRDNVVRLQAEDRHALACYRPEALVELGPSPSPTTFSARTVLAPALPYGHEEVARVGLGGGARWRSTS